MSFNMNMNNNTTNGDLIQAMNFGTNNNVVRVFKKVKEPSKKRPKRITFVQKNNKAKKIVQAHTYYEGDEKSQKSSDNVINNTDPTKTSTVIYKNVTMTQIGCGIQISPSSPSDSSDSD
jgi:hypothetical protein